MFLNFFIFLPIFFIFSNEIHCSFVSDQKIYKNLHNEFICFRTFNSTHQFGCQSKSGGSVGTVHIVKNKSDIDYVTKNGPNDPYIPCLRSEHFTFDNLVKFKDSGRVSGIVLFDLPSEDKLPDSLTEDQRCPNEMTSYYKNDPIYSHCKKEEWNKYASIESIPALNLDFPMLLIRDQEDIINIEKCFNNFNSKNNKKNYEPVKTTDLLCSIQIKTWMHAAKNSKVCISRSSSNFNLENVQYCEDFSSYNLFSTLFKYEEDEKINDRSIIMLASRIDSLSVFLNAATGAQTTFTSLITLFSVMKLLRDQRDKELLSNKNGMNLLYSLFDGEAYDYIGSGKTAYDLGNYGLYPAVYDNKELDLKFFKKHLNSAIEINQATSNDKFYIHTDPLTRKKESIKPNLDKLINTLTLDKFIEDVSEQDLPLPPSSVQQLLAHDLDLPVLVISNHKTDFRNKFYNSFLDDNRTITNKERVISKIGNLSESIAKTLISIIEQKDTKDLNLKADLDLINNLYDCFIVDIRCSFFNFIRGKETRLKPEFKTYPLYISVSSSESKQPYHFEYLMLLGRLSSYINGKILKNITMEKDCKDMNKSKSNVSYEWFKGNNSIESHKNICVETTRFFSTCKSPVFLSQPPNWSLNYSTWTESVWDAQEAKLFVSSSKIQEYFSFFTGLIILLGSFFISKYIGNNADALFKDLFSDNQNPPVSM